MKLGWKTFLKWKEPREATQWRHERAESARKPWLLPVNGAVVVALMLTTWWISRNPAKPSFASAFLFSVGVAIFVTSVVPRLVRRAPTNVWVRDYGIHWAQANNAKIVRYRDLAQVCLTARLPDAPLGAFMVLKLRKGGDVALGLSPEIDLAKLQETLSSSGVEVYPAEGDAGPTS